MKFNKILNELQGEIGDNQLYYKGRGTSAPNSEILQQKIINAVFAYIRDNSQGIMKELWNELNIKDTSEMDITMNSAANGALIKTEKGNSWFADVKNDPKTGSTKVLQIKRK